MSRRFVLVYCKRFATPAEATEGEGACRLALASSLVPFCGPLGAHLAILGLSRGSLGTLFGPLGAPMGLSWGSLGALLGPCWGNLGGCWGMLLTLLGSCPLLGLYWPFSWAKPCQFGHILDQMLGYVLDLVLEVLFEVFVEPKSCPGEGKERPRDAITWHFCCYLRWFRHVAFFAAFRFLGSSWWLFGATLASPGETSGPQKSPKIFKNGFQKRTQK